MKKSRKKEVLRVSKASRPVLKPKARSLEKLEEAPVYIPQKFRLNDYRKVALAIFLLLLVISLSGIIFVSVRTSKEKAEAEEGMLDLEKAVNGTPIMDARNAVKEAIASGKPILTKDDVLYTDGKDFLCTIETDKGIIKLEKRDDLIRQEMMREKIYNTSVIFNGSYLFIYHPIEHFWARFDYNPEQRISHISYFYSAFSFKELTEINETKWSCIETKLPREEFSLGNITMFDASAYLRQGSLIK